MCTHFWVMSQDCQINRRFMHGRGGGGSEWDTARLEAAYQFHLEGNSLSVELPTILEESRITISSNNKQCAMGSNKHWVMWTLRYSVACSWNGNWFLEQHKKPLIDLLVRQVLVCYNINAISLGRTSTKILFGSGSVRTWEVTLCKIVHEKCFQSGIRYGRVYGIQAKYQRRFLERSKGWEIKYIYTMKKRKYSNRYSTKSCPL